MAGNLMRKTTVSPAFVGSPTRVASWTPFGNAGLSFQITASGVTRCACLALSQSLQMRSKRRRQRAAFSCCLLPANGKWGMTTYQSRPLCRNKFPDLLRTGRYHRMSPSGQQRRCRDVRGSSAMHPIANGSRTWRQGSSGPKAAVRKRSKSSTTASAVSHSLQ